MNQFQTIQSGQGELKDSYESNEPAKIALKKRRQKKFYDLGLVMDEDIQQEEEKKKMLEE